MKRTISILWLIWAGICTAQAAKSYDNADTIVVAQDGSGEFQTISEAVEVCRAFMEYHKVIYIKKGVYCEKVVIPSWLTNIELCGEDAETTILTHNDHANMVYPNTKMKLSTFRTYTLKIEGSDITIKNLTMESGCRAIMIMYPTEDIILDNVNIGGDGVLYPINTGEAGSEGVNLIVTNSTLAGWTSYGEIESASFTNVKFEQGTYYKNIYGRVLKPYVNTTITDCSFIAHMNLDLSKLVSGHKIVFKNCKVDGQELTIDKFTIPSTDAEYDTELFTIDLPDWATSITDCVVFE